MKKKNDKYHNFCRIKFNNTKLERAQIPHRSPLLSGSSSECKSPIANVLEAIGNSISQHKLEDVNGGKLSSLTVFSECLKFLKDDVLAYMKHMFTDIIRMRDFYWIITVPTFWSDHGKQFMRLAARQAGIVDELLSLVDEPVAVAIYCKMWQSTKCITSPKEQDDKNNTMTAFDTAGKFLVINCGEDMVHISAYKNQESNKHIELIRPTRVPCGGRDVDNQFLNLVIEIFGVDIWHKFEQKYRFECLKTMRRIESKRSVIGSSDADEVKIRLPAELFQEYRWETGLEFRSAKGVTRSRDKLVFPIQVLNDFFEKSANEIACHVRQLLQKPELEGLGTIFMAGSFSESPFLYEHMKSEFSSFNVLRPKESGLSGLKGAVIFGFTPETIPDAYL
ncbi:unnamed protein product [Mytilus coruscus]|uniref:HSPA12B n=1 Tax=Mytilus coruscus TaxID=42192 RepID=A0A6J8AHK2_MYTCO|nr:unnamed protein product [Mytilus coruscus]